MVVHRDSSGSIRSVDYASNANRALRSITPCIQTQFTGTQDSSLATSFRIDDTSVTAT